MKNLYLTMTFVMIITAIFWFVSGIMALQPTRINACIILFGWMVCLMGAYMYYSLYKELKNDQQNQNFPLRPKSKRRETF